MLFFDLFRHDPNLVTVAQDAHLFEEGEAGSDMFVLLSGHAAVVRGGVEIERLAPGDIVGEVALLGVAPRLATVRAVTECVFATVDEARFRFLVEEAPYFALEVMRVMARRLGESNARMIPATTAA
ncbi:MAG: cyclic nucleotide-binding domain-containing protein [Rhodocyclaceae bacterium]|nr:cyclic nucleotide-binding domain-containing protein [Rhodocyclaceae bacterium]